MMLRQMEDRRRASGSETKQRLLAAAEELFSTLGYDRVGMREITRAAGANTAAIHYHFGSKQDLLLELLRARAQPIATERDRLLHDMRQKGKLILEEVLAAFLKPALFGDRKGDLQHSPFAELRARLAFQDEPNVRALLAEIFDETSNRYIEALAECLPHLDKVDIYFRFHFLLGTMVYSMSNPGRVQELSHGASDLSDRQLVMANLVPFLAAGFRAASVHKASGKPLRVHSRRD
jgi:AcrR family transcriptional regulator